MRLKQTVIVVSVLSAAAFFVGGAILTGRDRGRPPSALISPLATATRAASTPVAVQATVEATRVAIEPVVGATTVRVSSVGELALPVSNRSIATPDDIAQLVAKPQITGSITRIQLLGSEGAIVTVELDQSRSALRYSSIELVVELLTLQLDAASSRRLATGQVVHARLSSRVTEAGLPRANADLIVSAK